ncbi:three-helix bundle dimerization domain-containing protein [Microbacterium sp. DT81.1]|uniref:three-helix bundle dimerization domain-containing protein n=1 Tax=Microbacterium sp. DT81.1 TaxID=3393413 RepID=UPI003CF019E9
MSSPDQDKRLAAIIERLEKQFPELPPPEVEAVTREAHDAFNDHPTTNYVPGLIERQAKERLLGRSAQAAP